jgi:ribosomal RNA assembly protein
MEFSQDVKVPQDRVAVLIGKAGVTKKLLMSKLKVHLDIDSDEGVVLLSANDGLDLMIAKDVVKAIARGFNPEVALELLKEGNFFDLIDLADYLGKSQNKMQRVRSRIIGSEGKARRHLSNISGVEIVVYGKTVGLIGESQRVRLVHRAIETLLSGSKHGYVYKWIDEEIAKLH